MVVGLLSGQHIVEFKTIAGRETPSARAVTVVANQLTVVGVTYSLADGSTATTPSSLQFLDIIESPLDQFKLPYAFCGQVQSDAGYGSGVVVKEKVVLTAAHVVFNDATLSHVDQARWFFQRQAGDYEPLPQSARGWYVFSGYAAQRAAENTPGQSSPVSQNQDVAALYFLNPAGRGGYTGYLVSDAGGTEWLQVSELKTLVGYPVEGIAQNNIGRMHATLPANVQFSRLLDPLVNRVFTTTSIRGYPGMSGGPVCVRYTNGRYYPAAVFLGGSGQTVVRAIDGGVAELINRAETTANTGDNNTGGGVILWAAGNSTAFNPGLFRVNFSPTNIVAQGAAWRVKDGADPTWLSDNNLYYPLTPGAFNIEFRPVAGYGTPLGRAINVVANQTAVIDVYYNLLTFSPPQFLANGNLRMTMSGTTGRIYQLQASTNLVNWTDIRSLTNANGVLVFTNAPISGSPKGFYRVRE
jgi:hypothetical protein